jgi:predicted Holliday junction resolvase-like endonuclease
MIDNLYLLCGLLLLDIFGLIMVVFNRKYLSYIFRLDKEIRSLKEEIKYEKSEQKTENQLELQEEWLLEKEKEIKLKENLLMGKSDNGVFM